MTTTSLEKEILPESQSDTAEERKVIGYKKRIKSAVSLKEEWKAHEKIAFRIAFIFFIALSIPNNPDWYDQVIHIDWTNLHYRDLYDICRFGSGINFFGSTIFGNNLLGYANWVITLFIATLGGLVWTAISNRSKSPAKEYRTLYYWLRVVVRYRAALGIIGFGFTKLLPVQMPYPSLGILNTNFGDFTTQKIYWLSIAIVPWYQIFAGIVEIGAGTLLFFRKTTTLGAVLLFGALGDIVYVNFAYDGGVHVYSSYFVLLSGFLIAKDIPGIYNLLIREKYTHIKNYYPVWTKSWQKYGRFAIKAAVIFVFLFVFFYLQFINFRYDPYKQPSVAGIQELRGNYDVAEFRINNKIIPYDPADTIRWKEVTFEKWSTLTYVVNKPTPIDLSNGGGDPQRDINRTFEVSGTGGGRRVFHYYPDVTTHTLYLEDKYKAIADRRNRAAGEGGDGGTSGETKTKDILKNEKKPVSEKEKSLYSDKWISIQAWKNIGDERTKINPIAASSRRDREFKQNEGKFDKRKRMILNYHTTDGSQIILTGINENADSLHIVLNRIDKVYTLPKSTLSAGSYDNSIQ